MFTPPGAQVDEADERLWAVEAVAAVTDEADIGVQTFESGVAQAEPHGGQDAVLVFADRAGEVHEGLELGARRPRQPRLEVLGRLVPKDLTAAHAVLVERHEHVLQCEAQLGKQIEEARVKDAEQARRAVAAGKSIPTRTEVKLLNQLDDIRRERTAVESVIANHNEQLLAAAAPGARKVSDQLRGEAGKLEDEAVGLLVEAGKRLDKAGQLRGEAAWAAELAAAKAAERHPAFRTGRKSESDAARTLRAAIEQAGSELRRRPYVSHRGGITPTYSRQAARPQDRGEQDPAEREQARAAEP